MSWPRQPHAGRPIRGQKLLSDAVRNKKGRANEQSAAVAGEEAQNASVGESSAGHDVAPMPEVVLSGRWRSEYTRNQIQGDRTLRRRGDGSVACEAPDCTTCTTLDGFLQLLSKVAPIPRANLDC